MFGENTIWSCWQRLLTTAVELMLSPNTEEPCMKSGLLLVYESGRKIKWSWNDLGNPQNRFITASTILVAIILMLPNTKDNV